MNKKYIVSVAIMLVFAAVLASCKARSTVGKLYIAGEKESYVLKTDANGNTVVNEDGDLIVIKMRNAKEPHHDTDGNPITEVLQYPEFIDEGKKLDCKYYKVKIPSGWKNAGRVSMKLENKNLGATIDFTNEGEKTYDEVIADIDLFAAEAEKNGGKTEKGTVKILGQDCQYLTIIAKDNDAVFTAYVLEHNDHMFRFICNYTKDSLGKVDFIEVLNGIEFK